MTGTDSTTSEAAKQLDRDSVCGCPYCVCYRYGSNIPEPSISERAQAALRLATRGEPEDKDALSRARDWLDEPPSARERIVNGEEYKMMMRVAERRRAAIQQEQQKKPDYSTPVQAALSDAMEQGRSWGRASRAMPSMLAQLLGGVPTTPKQALSDVPAGVNAAQQGQSKTIETPFGTITIVAMDPGTQAPPAEEPEQQSAVEAYEEQMNAAIARLGELLKDDEEMDQHDREIAILRLAEIQLLWKARF